MAKRGTFFFQTYAYEPNYYKGPLHYLLLISGLKLFGLHAWVAHFMNEIFLLFTGFSIFKIIERRVPSKPEFAFFFSVAACTCFGFLTYLYASQMELELIGFFALSLFFLDLDRVFAFWIVAGLCGWVKSPLHSVLIGTSALLWWTLSRELSRRLRSPKQWLAAGLGILVCAAGYAPAFFFDRANFMQFYFLRETFEKPGNQGPWWTPVLPFFIEAPLPWLPIFFYSFFGRLRLKPRSLFTLGFSLVLPCVAFFLYHPYRVKNYDYPALSGLFLMVAAALIEGGAGLQNRAARAQAWFLTVFSMAALALLVHVPGPSGHWPFPVWASGVLLLGLSVNISLQRQRRIGYGLAIAGGLLAFWLNGLFNELGSFELRGLHALRAQNSIGQLAYSNLKHKVWNEWGLLSFELSEEILPLYSEADVDRALAEKRSILVSDDEDSVLLKEMLHRKLGDKTLKPLFWNRLNRRAVWRNWLREPKWDQVQIPYVVIPLKTE